MKKDTGFSYTYSAATNQEVQKIRNKYMPKQESKLEELRRLDHEVQISGIKESLTDGILGFLLFGVGVHMATKGIMGSVILGIVFGLSGAIAMAFAYPIYRKVLNKARETLVPRILELTSELSG